jgi:membrane-bound ClpP family serine protease
VSFGVVLDLHVHNILQKITRPQLCHTILSAINAPPFPILLLKIDFYLFIYKLLN